MDGVQNGCVCACGRSLVLSVCLCEHQRENNSQHLAIAFAASTIAYIRTRVRKVDLCSNDNEKNHLAGHARVFWCIRIKLPFKRRREKQIVNRFHSSPPLSRRLFAFAFRLHAMLSARSLVECSGRDGENGVTCCVVTLW